MAQIIVSLVLRLLTFVFLLTALIIITTNTTALQLRDSVSEQFGVDELPIHFQYVIGYRYLLSTIVIGLAFIFVQIGLAVPRFKKGDSQTGAYGRLLYVEFYIDKVLSYMLATGTAAGFAVTTDLKPAVILVMQNLTGDMHDLNNYFAKGYATAAIVLVAFLFSAASSVLSSLALPKTA